MKGRTVILVSHHVQLCAPGADFIVALDNGRVIFQGDRETFQSSDVINGLVQSSGDAEPVDKEEKEQAVLESVFEKTARSMSSSQTSSTRGTLVPESKREQKAPRKLIEEEKRAVGRISRDVWETYFKACGDIWYWAGFGALLFIGAFSPVFEYGWLR
jgi:ABC-type multidrug transport system ATPase subunit